MYLSKGTVASLVLIVFVSQWAFLFWYFATLASCLKESEMPTWSEGPFLAWEQQIWSQDAPGFSSWPFRRRRQSRTRRWRRQMAGPRGSKWLGPRRRLWAWMNKTFQFDLLTLPEEALRGSNKLPRPISLYSFRTLSFTIAHLSLSLLRLSYFSSFTQQW